MNRKSVSSRSPFEKQIGFTRAVRIGNSIVVSGTGPIAANGGRAFPNDLYNQTKACIEIMKKAIEDAGGTMTSIVRTRVYLKNAQEWEKAAKAHLEYFSDIKPASTFVEVKGFVDTDWLVEMEADCIVS